MSTTTAVAAIAVSHVSKTFPGQRALDDVSLTVECGEVHALLGENGSGKSTLIKILAGFHEPDPGAEALVGGEPLAFGSPQATRTAGLRFVHQHLSVIPELDAVENIALEAGYRRGANIDWRAQEAYTRELLGRLAIDMDIRRPLRDCKPVERSAVAIARALRSEEPDTVKAVILDEPTSSLPAAEVRQLFGVIQGVVARGIGVLYVSHRMDEVFEIADRVSVLRDGSLRATKRIQDVTRDQLVELIVGRDLAGAFEHRAIPAAPTDEVPPLLRFDGLTSDVLQDVSFTVRPGEVVGAVGIAGSGRDVLARTIVGASPIQAGTLSVDGIELPRLSVRATRKKGIHLGLSNTQDGAAVRSFTVGENLSIASLHRFSKAMRLARGRERRDAEHWIEVLDIRPTDQDRAYGLLSGGNQQKVILGKCLAAGPRVLVLDEPTAGVDVGARQAIYRLIDEQAESGLAVVLCSSDLEDIVTVCHRAIVLRDGRIVAEVTGDALTEPNLLAAQLGRGGASDATASQSTDREGTA